MSKGSAIHLDEGHNYRHTHGGLGGFVAFKNAASLYYSSEQEFAACHGAVLLVRSKPVPFTFIQKYTLFPIAEFRFDQ